ncbi:sugar-binding transcriptional regulator [Rubrivirga sp.]|uniref:sugar-binding transcriptional regulator n=1 Tax=Rubrivirga sp. TaxID=1885344 RepID=UPI003B530282
MPPASETSPRTLAKVAALYYLQGQTQQQIADRLRVSRPTVSRMIKEARERGIVQITVAHVDGLAVDLESELETAFGLSEVVVADVEGDDVVARLGAAAAGFLARTLEPGDVVGLTWGSTLRAMVKAVAPRRTDGVTVVQTLGGVGPPLGEAHAADLPRRLAGALGADLRLLQAPGVVASPEARAVLEADPQIRASLDALATMTVAFVGIGSLDTNPVLGDGALASEVDLPPTLAAELEAGDAVGDVALRFFDVEGRPVPTSLDDRIVGVDFETLADVDCVVGVAGGAAKVDAIRAAVRGRLVDVLITDDATARALRAT